MNDKYPYDTCPIVSYWTFRHTSQDNRVECPDDDDMRKYIKQLMKSKHKKEITAESYTITGENSMKPLISLHYKREDVNSPWIEVNSGEIVKL